MQRRRLGRFEVSVVGLGSNNFGTTFATPVDARGTRQVADAALEAGVNLIDTADVYGDSEAYLGEALRGRRDDVVVATKFGGQFGPDPSHRGASAQWITQAVEGSLQRLQTDRIDLYQLHVPDPNTPIDETLTALDALVRAGKVVEIGCSNFSGELIDEAHKSAASLGVRCFASAQNDLGVATFGRLTRGRDRDALGPAGRGMSSTRGGRLRGRWRAS